MFRNSSNRLDIEMYRTCIQCSVKPYHALKRIASFSIHPSDKASKPLEMPHEILKKGVRRVLKDWSKNAGGCRKAAKRLTKDSIRSQNVVHLYVLFVFIIDN